MPRFTLRIRWLWYASLLRTTPIRDFVSAKFEGWQVQVYTSSYLTEFNLLMHLTVGGVVRVPNATLPDGYGDQPS